MSTHQKDWLNRKEAAAHLTALGYPIAPRTLATLAGRKKGPPYRRILHRLAVYNKAALEKWMLENSVDISFPRIPKIRGALSKRVTA